MKNTCKKRLVERGAFAAVATHFGQEGGEVLQAYAVAGFEEYNHGIDHSADGAAIYAGDVHLFLFLTEATRILDTLMFIFAISVMING